MSYIVYYQLCMSDVSPLIRRMIYENCGAFMCIQTKLHENTHSHSLTFKLYNNKYFTVIIYVCLQRNYLSGGEHGARP